MTLIYLLSLFDIYPLSDSPTSYHVLIFIIIPFHPFTEWRAELPRRFLKKWSDGRRDRTQWCGRPIEQIQGRVQDPWEKNGFLQRVRTYVRMQKYLHAWSHFLSLQYTLNYSSVHINYLDNLQFDYAPVLYCVALYSIALFCTAFNQSMKSIKNYLQISIRDK